MKKIISIVVLILLTTFCYSVSSASITGSFTASNPFFTSISSEYPSNESTGVERPPTNISANITGNDVTVYFYFVNMSGVTDTWTQLYHQENVTNEIVEMTALDSFGSGNEFDWGNTTYTWSINISDEFGWTNESFWYETEGIASGSDARLDVNNDVTVDIFDVTVIYNWYDEENSYNGYFDVNVDTLIDIFDCRDVYNGYN